MRVSSSIKKRSDAGRLTATGLAVAVGGITAYTTQRYIRGAIARQRAVEDVLAQAIYVIGSVSGDYQGLVHLAATGKVANEHLQDATTIRYSPVVSSGFDGHPYYRHLAMSFETCELGAVEAVVYGHSEAIHRLRAWLEIQDVVEIQNLSLTDTTLTFRIMASHKEELAALRRRLERVAKAEQSYQPPTVTYGHPAQNESEGG